MVVLISYEVGFRTKMLTTDKERHSVARGPWGKSSNPVCVCEAQDAVIWAARRTGKEMVQSIVSTRKSQHPL